MTHWGEMIPEPLDSASHELLLNSVPKFSKSSEFDLPENDHGFGGNPNFKSKSVNLETSATTGQQQDQRKFTSPFFETLKLLVAKETDVKEEDEEDSVMTKIINEKTQLSNEMRQSIIMILTHVGFHNANYLTIDLLVDVLEYFLKSFGKLLRNFTDSIDLQSPNDFYDLIDKTFHHMNVPNFEVLRKYNDELVEYHQRVQNEHKTKPMAPDQNHHFQNGLK